MNSRIGSKPTLRLSWLSAGWAIALVASLGRLAVSGEPLDSSTRLDLPDRLANYARPDLPGHFQTPLVRRLDNTPTANPTTDAGATLGRVLFYDRRFSKDGSLSCGSCHAQKNAFAEPNRVSLGVGGQLGDRNAMSLVNARFVQNGKFFWDERAGSLEAQVLLPIQDPREMAHQVDQVVATIRLDPVYAPLFVQAFGDQGVTADRVASALAQFVRSMVSYRSKFDEGLAQAGSIHRDFANFTPVENLGKSIFLGDHDPASRGNCATCHLRDYVFRPTNQARQTAIFQADRLLNNGLDAEIATKDNGVGDRTLNLRDYGLFKTPDLRDVERTAPYMHDGRFATLEQVVEHYNSGVKPHPNLDPQLRVGRGQPAPRLMNLDEPQKAGLVAFLKTLTDHQFLDDPKFSDPFRR